MEPRLERQRLLKAGNGLVVAALLLPDQRQVEVGFSERRRLLDDRGKAGASSVKIALAHGLRGLSEFGGDLGCLRPEEAR